MEAKFRSGTKDWSLGFAVELVGAGDGAEAYSHVSGRPWARSRRGARVGLWTNGWPVDSAVPLLLGHDG